MLVSLVLVILSFGCTSVVQKTPARNVRDLLISENREISHKKWLSKAEIDLDIELLIYALEEAYGGRKFIEVHTFKTIIDKLRSLKSNEFSTVDLCDEVGSILAKIPDNHMTTKLRGRRCGHKLSAPRSLVGENIYRGKKPWGLIFKKEIPVFSIKHLPQYEDPSWRGFSESLEKLLNGNPRALIVDLRGNGGGSDARGKEFAQKIFGQDPPQFINMRTERRSAEAKAILRNNWVLRIGHLREIQKKVPDYYHSRLKSASLEFEAALAKGNRDDIVYYFKSKPYRKDIAFHKPIYLLIDRACASSCEDIVSYFKGHPLAKTVGTNTGGYVQFGNIGTLALKNSGILIQLATDFWEFHDGKRREFIGFTPDIKVEEGKDALEAALQDLGVR